VVLPNKYATNTQKLNKGHTTMKTFKQHLEEAQEFSSAGTSQSQVAKGFSTVAKHIGWKPDTLNVDLGGGKYDHGVKFLQGHGVESHVLDPFNRPEEHNKKVAETVKARGGADTVTLFNVLNTIKEPEVHREVLEAAKSHLKPGGRLFVSVYSGDKSGVGRQTKADSWQRNENLRDYLKAVHSVFPNAGIQKGVIHAIIEFF
jgi:hypothetical protein